jgi:putative CocE/NonD family hydrolase
MTTSRAPGQLADPDGSAARSASEPQFEVDTRLGVAIVMRDGVSLSANLWLPVPLPDPLEKRFPAILEMIPYGKDNWRRNADVARGTYLARRGYVLCRVDVRGTGSSGGVALDEYTADESQDGYEVVEWLAAQPWCTGAVGMWGISYGGFTSIQVAKLRPPHLKAIVPIQATDDRYLTDVHYIGGCVTASELSQYAVSQVAMNAMPPDPSLWGETWRTDWLARLEATPPWLFGWLRQQHDGPYWRQGSLAPDYDAIEAAILNVGGWMDSYVDAVFRMQERCTAPSRTIVGNWVHGLPASATPGPNLDDLHELVRFFDRWLKGVPNGADAEPAIVWYERDFADPTPFPDVLPGRWRAATAYPHPAVEIRGWSFASGSLPLVGRLVGPGEPVDGTSSVDTFRHLPTNGTRGGLSWGAGGPPNGLARDLRPDESLTLTYTSEPLPEPLEILGVPAVQLFIEASAPVATVVVRLTEVASDGTSAQVSAGMLNLTHAGSHEHPRPLPPGGATVVVEMRPAGYRFQAGNRIRVSIASAAWPVIWPSPYPTTFRVHHGAGDSSELRLPVIPAAGGPGDMPVPTFKTTPPDLPDVGAEGVADEPIWRIAADVIHDTVTVSIHDGGEDVLDDGRRLYAAETLELTASDSDPAHASLDADVVYRWQEQTFEAEIRARSRQTSDAEAFDLAVELEVDVDGEPFFRRRWQESIPRRLV